MCLHDDITFYNDSKATMPAATLQALTQLQTHHLILNDWWIK